MYMYMYIYVHVKLLYMNIRDKVFKLYVHVSAGTIFQNICKHVIVFIYLISVGNFTFHLVFNLCCVYSFLS